MTDLSVLPLLGFGDPRKVVALVLAPRHWCEVANCELPRYLHRGIGAWQQSLSVLFL